MYDRCKIVVGRTFITRSKSRPSKGEDGVSQKSHNSNALQNGDILAKVNTINNWVEVNYIIHIVPSTKLRMMFNFKYAVKYYN